MQCQRHIAIAVLSALFTVTPSWAQSASTLLQKGIFTEETVGDLDAAIKIYEQIVTEAEANRSHVAQAQYRLGVCYLKKGQEQEAAIAFRKLIDQFPKQTELITQAHTRLSALGHPISAVAVRQVWAPALDTMGAVSPDGRYLSYVNWNTGNLAVHDLQTGENRDVTTEGTWDGPAQWAENSIWSPDGQQLAYIWYPKDWRDRMELRITGLDGSGTRVLCHDRDLGYPQPCAWSRDGRSILAILHHKDRSHELVLVSIADDTVRVLKSAPTEADWGHGYVSLSPDGQTIVYDLELKQEGRATHDIFLLATDGSREVRLVDHPADDFAPVWTPDGKRIVFISDRAGANGLWTVEVVDDKPQGTPELVKPDIGDIDPMGFTLDGSYYYSVAWSNSDLYTATLDLEAGKVLSPAKKLVRHFEGYNTQPAWSPDGKSLAYVLRENRAAKRSRVLVIRSVETGEERELAPKLRQLSGGGPAALRWSPDGRSILVSGRDAKPGNGLFLVDAQTGDVSTVVQDEEIGAQPPAWSPDGKVLFYLQENGTEGSQRIVAHNLETGREKELYRGKLGALALSPDGRRLAWVESSGPWATLSVFIRAMPAAGGEPRELLQLPEGLYISRRAGLAWTPDGHRLIFGTSTISDNPAPPTIDLCQVSAEGGKLQKLGLAMEGLAHLSLHPDGRRIAFTGSGSGRGAEIWAIENFLPELKASP